MKRNIILFIIFILFWISILLLGSLFTVGDKIGAVSRYLEWSFYGVILAFTIWVTIIPIIRVFFAPQLPAITLPGNCDIATIRNVANQVVNTCYYIPDKRNRQKHSQNLKTQVQLNYSDPYELRKIISHELDLRLNGNSELGVKGINKSIYDWALSSFMITAVSQSGKIDAISTFIMNVRLTADIVRAAGFRLNNAQMMRLYFNIFFTSVASYALSTSLSGLSLDASSAHNAFPDANATDTLDHTDAVDTSDTMVDSVDLDDADAADAGNTFFGNMLNGLKSMSIIKMFVSSSLDGTANALLTLRIGFIAKAYVTQGTKAFKGINNKRHLRRSAVFAAYRAIPKILTEGKSRIRIISKLS